MDTQVTIFKNIKETETPFFKEVSFILKRIKEGKSKNLIKEIRKEKDKTARNELKKNLPAICFSGQFNKRSDASLLEHSGIMCLDFDGYKKQKDMLQDKEMFINNKFVLSVFVSPSGNGLKVLIKIPADADNHIKYFTSLKTEFDSTYFDTTSKNLSRVCYESYDPLLYYNPNSLIWDTIEEEEHEERSSYKDKPTIKITDENKIVEILVKWWTKRYPMAEGQRNHNVYILAMAFNDFGISKSLASFICNQYESKSFPKNEIETTIQFSVWKDTKFWNKVL